MTGPTQTYQLSVEAAEAYEARFVPALFAEWAPHLVEAAGVAAGQAVLDVACGTGVVARTAADRVGGRGRVAGVDLNEGMLAVAGRLRPDIEWHQADAAALPFPDGSFDAVLCQSGLMFFPDRVGALREMARVAAAGGTVAVQVWDLLEAQAGYGAMYAAFTRHLGPTAGELGGSFWALGDLELLGSLFEAAGSSCPSAGTWWSPPRRPEPQEGGSNSPSRAPARKARHSSGVNRRAGPLRSLESRTTTWSPTRPTSTQPLLPL